MSFAESVVVTLHGFSTVVCLMGSEARRGFTLILGRTRDGDERAKRELIALVSTSSTIEANRNAPSIRQLGMTRRYLADDAKRGPQRVIGSFAVDDTGS
jgi:hypothetical protein